MKKEKNIKYFCWFSIIIAIIHFTMETWYHFKFGQSIIQLICDYIGISLLLFGGITVLNKIEAKGLLCGAWGFIFCLNYRTFAWRMDEFTNGSSTELIDKTLIVLSFTLFFSLISFVYSLIICYPKEKE